MRPSHLVRCVRCGADMIIEAWACADCGSILRDQSAVHLRAWNRWALDNYEMFL